MQNMKADCRNFVEIAKLHLLNGGSRAEIFQETAKKFKVSTRTMDKWLKIAKEEHENTRAEITEKTNRIIDLEVEKRVGSIMSVIERKEVLTAIARGEIPLSKPMVVDKFIENVPIVPDYMDRKNAIAELNKMDGDYAPTKTDIRVGKIGKDLEEEETYE